MKLLLLFFLLVIRLSSAQQKTIPCDSLVGKPVEFLFGEATSIIEGTITKDHQFKEDAWYEIRATWLFKGFTSVISFRQDRNENWFDFKKGQSYIFLSFPKKYQDHIFTPCILFGKKENMKAFTDYFSEKCKVPVEEDLSNSSCIYIYMPVCGCDGITYGNQCEASKAGVQYWCHGICNE